MEGVYIKVNRNFTMIEKIGAVNRIKFYGNNVYKNSIKRAKYIAIQNFFGAYFCNEYLVLASCFQHTLVACISGLSG